MKKILLIRLGAYGDILMITPVIRYYKKQGWHVSVLTSERGMDILKGNPHVDELLFQETDKVPNEKLAEYWEEIEKKVNADKVINFSETIEVALALHPRDPQYYFPKKEREALCNKNYYEHTMRHAGVDIPEGINWSSLFLQPEYFVSPDEEFEFPKDSNYAKGGLRGDTMGNFIKGVLRPDKFNVLLGMAGSGKNKTWPYNEPLCGSILNEWKDKVHIITVGDYSCKLIEPQEETYITNLAGEIPIRVSMALTGVVDLVITPDTGILHAAGMSDVPTIALLGHSTHENVSKHFPNVIPIESDPNLAECSPCFKLIYNMQLYCPTDPSTKGAYCMSKGIAPERVFEAVKRVYANREIRQTVNS